MLITCPNCLTQFNVDECALQKAQQTFLCSVCQHQWQQQLPVSVENEPAVAEAEEKSFTFEAPKKNKMRQIRSVPKVFQPVSVVKSQSVWWIVLIGLCCFIGAIVIAKLYRPMARPVVKNQIVKPKFLIQNVKVYTDKSSDGQMKMRIYGDILNPGNTGGAVPYLVADLKDEQGHIVQSILLPQKGIWLDAHEKYLFFEEITLPRPEALKVHIHF